MGTTGQKFAYLNGQSVQSYQVPLAGGVQAVYNASGLQYYRLVDWLGSSRLGLNMNGANVYDRAFAPFGESYAETGSADRSFTGQTQDVLAGPTSIYDFLFRQHSSAQGRWLTPDPAGLAAVDLTNPQTWNRYAYVGNNPLSFIDPLGLCAENGGLPTNTGTDSDGNPTFTYTTSNIPCSDEGAPTGGGDWKILPGCVSFGGSPPVGCEHGGWHNVDIAEYLWKRRAGDPQRTPPSGNATNNGRLPNGDVPLNPYAQAVFSHPTLQTAASTMTDARTYALWTAGSAVAGTAMAFGPTSIETAVTLTKNIALDPTYIGFAMDALSGWTPASFVPATYGGFFGLGTNQLYEWWKKR